METKIKVLDHGFVRLVEHMGSDLSIVRAARVSYDADWRAGSEKSSDERLINYLYKNRHTSPFEAVVFTFEVKAPIFVLRQWHRHRTWSYNEVSARYTVLPEDCYVPLPELLGKQDNDNKQTRSTDPADDAEKHVDAIRYHTNTCFLLYKQLLKQGVARELARSVLPVATYSRMFATVNLHNIFHFFRLRMHPHAQYEIREYAKALLGLVEQVVPVATSAFRQELLERQ